MSTSPNAVIGYIVDVQGNLLVATLIEDEQGHAPIVTIGDEDVLVGQLGSYVAVKQKRCSPHRGRDPNERTGVPCWADN